METSQLSLTTIQVGEGGDNLFTLSQAFTYASIIDLQKERDENQQVELMDKWFPLRDLDSFTVLGSFAWSSPSIKRKWIMRKHARFDAVWVTPADRARDYLRVNGHHKQRRRVTTDQYHRLFDRKRSHPLYAVPCEIDNAYYVDIQSAYWSILKIVGWNVDYSPGKWIGVQSSVEDFPFTEDKLARNSLVSVGSSGLLRVWNGSRLSFARRSNPFVNGVLWACIHDILHGIALDAVEAGAAYVHTDGYIVGENNLENVLQSIEAWGVPAGIKKTGKAIIRGAGDYDIGDSTGKRKRRAKPSYFNNLVSPRSDWLRAKVRRWSEKTP